MNRQLITTILFGAGVCLTGFALASAFQLPEEGVASSGNAHAGWAASVNDASTEYYNPAGMTRIKHQQLVVGGVLIPIDARFSGTASTTINGIVPQFGPVTGTAQGGGFNVIPNIHYVAPINDKFAVGVGMNVPFGLKTNWSESSIVRYAQTVTSVKVIDITPGFGYAILPSLSIGAGLDANYLKAEFGEMNGFGPNGNFDHLSRNRGTDWAVGWHAGLLWQITQFTRIGLTYYSSTVYHIADGESAFLTRGQFANLIAPDSYTRTLFARVKLPSTTALSIYRDMNKKLSLMGSLIFTKWKTIQTLTLNNVNLNGQNLQVNIPSNYRNTFAYAIGANYKVNKKILLRTGIMFDKTPTNSIDRNLRLPDADRLTVALGAHYQATQNLGVDVAWEHLFVHTAGVNNTTIVGPQGAQEFANILGQVKTHADVLGGSLTYNFT